MKRALYLLSIREKEPYIAFPFLIFSPWFFGGIRFRCFFSHIEVRNGNQTEYFSVQMGSHVPLMRNRVKKQVQNHKKWIREPPASVFSVLGDIGTGAQLCLFSCVFVYLSVCVSMSITRRVCAFHVRVYLFCFKDILRCRLIVLSKNVTRIEEALIYVWFSFHALSNTKEKRGI